MPAPKGPQWVDVFHASEQPDPTHTLLPTDRQVYDESDNYHPAVFHAGTIDAASQYGRPYIHRYQINVNHPSVSPVTWGDAPAILDADDYYEAQQNAIDGDNWLVHAGFTHMNRFKQAMSGKQPGLFEETPADVKYAANRDVVMPYRNRRESYGSVSYIIPKGTVGGSDDDDSPVRYGGLYNK